MWRFHCQARCLDWRFGSNFSEYENASGASHDLFRCACCGNCYGNRFLRSVRCNSFVLIAALLPPRLDEQKALCKKAKGFFIFLFFGRITATKNPKLKKNPTSSKKHGKSRRIRKKQVKQKRIIIPFWQTIGLLILTSIVPVKTKDLNGQCRIHCF